MWKSESDIKGKHSSERSEFSRISLNAFRMTSERVSVCLITLFFFRAGRKEIRELGMTLVIGARKKPPPLHLYKALLMAQVASNKFHNTHTPTQTLKDDQML